MDTVGFWSLVFGKIIRMVLLVGGRIMQNQLYSDICFLSVAIMQKNKVRS